ncbi:TPA: hypothetical protein ACHSNL_001830 [Klebsiella variicola]
MTKDERQQLETICRYLKDGYRDLDCGRIERGIHNVNNAEVLLDTLLSMEEARLKKKS